jgi:hypothetical protein
MKHIHADLIREWALDTSRVVQYRCTSEDEWDECIGKPVWGDAIQYRFKPAPQPDYHVYTTINGASLQVSNIDRVNIKLTFDGETNQLKASEVFQ